MGPSVDVELADMATGLGVSTRKLMARVLNGGYDQIGENDLIRGNKGDPLFFRIDRRRAYSIFGDRIDEYEKDLSTVEEMSTGAESRENAPEVATRHETQTRGAVATKNAGDSPGRKVDNRRASTAKKMGQAALVLGGALALSWILSGGQDQRPALSDQQRQELFDQGYNGFYQGVEYNPYDPETEAGALYEQGWKEGRRQAIKNPMIDARLA